MRDSDWRLLAALKTHQSITKTAEALYITQPTITKHLRKIEEELQVQIVVRSSKGISFTAQGEYLGNRAEEILALIDDTVRHVQEMDEGRQGTLRVAVPNSFARNNLPAIIQGYKEVNPRVNFEVSTHVSDEIPRLINTSGVDVAFVCGDHEVNGISYLYQRSPLYAVYSKPFTLEDLPVLPRIEYMRSQVTYRSIESWWNEMFKLPPQTYMKVNHGDTCREMVMRGLGYGFFFGDNYIGDDEGLYRVPVVYPDGTPFTRNIWLIYSKEDAQRELVKRFVNFLRSKKQSE